jgi:beta-lactam-binding protein with PASTA domain
MPLSPAAVFGIIFASCFVAILPIFLITAVASAFFQSTEESPEEIRSREEIASAATETELQELRIRHEQERNQKAEERADRAYFSWT